MGAYYSLAVKRFQPILLVGLWKSIDFCSGLRWGYYLAVAEFRDFIARFLGKFNRGLRLEI
jgi:hypothetical protein